MKTMTRFWVTLFGVGLAILPVATLSRAQDAATPQNGYSHVRIVRLSFVEGTVTVQKPDLADWSIAPINTPIQEGFKLSTSEQSFAEVEFENTSTARLGQLTLIDFDQLVMSPNGGKVNRMTLEQGYATFTVHPEGMEAFEIKAQDATITLAAGTLTQFRVDLDGGAVRVEVFKGAANVSSSQGQQTLTRNTVGEIRPGAEQAFNVTQGIVKDAWDQWVNDRDGQEAVVRNSPTPGIYSADNNNSYYGWNDLSSYGNWNYFPGYGYGWAPYMAVGWSPFMDGRWCWYPGFGYTWISGEPWGWLPYHYGGWAFQAGFGWTWFPSNFAMWSPGNVNWSQGSGWVGWTPRPPQGRSGSGGCAQSQYCGRIIVRPETLRGGMPVTRASLMNPDLTGGRTVAKPDILPSRSGMLPGALFSSTAAIGGKTNAGRGQQANESGVVTSGKNSVVVDESSGDRSSGPRPVMVVAGSRGAGAATSEPGVAFDPATGRFVNSNAPRPESPNTRPNSGAPAMDRSEGGTILAPGQESPGTTRGTVAPAGQTYHNQAPTMRPAPAPSSGSHFWGGSHSNSSQGSGSRSNGGGYGGVRSGSFGSSSGSQSSGGGSSHSSGGGGGGSSQSSGGGSGGSHNSSGGSPHK